MKLKEAREDRREERSQLNKLSKQREREIESEILPIYNECGEEEGWGRNESFVASPGVSHANYQLNVS
jgi:hypothetical protein